MLSYTSVVLRYFFCERLGILSFEASPHIFFSSAHSSLATLYHEWGAIVGFYLSGILSLSQVQSSASLVSPVRLHHYFHLSVAKAGLLFATVAFGCGSTVFMPGLQRDTDKAAFVSTHQLGHPGPVQCNLNSSICWSVIHPFFLVTLSRSSSCFVSRQLVAPPPTGFWERGREDVCQPNLHSENLAPLPEPRIELMIAKFPGL